MAFVVVSGIGSNFNMIVTLQLHREIFGSSLKEASEDLGRIYSPGPVEFKAPIEFEVHDTTKAAHFVYRARQIGVICRLHSGLYDIDYEAK